MFPQSNAIYEIILDKFYSMNKNKYSYSFLYFSMILLLIKFES